MRCMNRAVSVRTCRARQQPVLASLAFAPAAERRATRKAMVHMAYSTPAQFSSFYGAKMLLPECYVSRGKLNLQSLLRKPAQMSFLGVGAPEALLVGVVALVVFGPKGLADAAKSIGATLRAFQPTIKEVVEVSQELKGTLEKELGLDEMRQATRPMSRTPDSLQPATETMARQVDPDIERKRAESANLAWGGPAPAESPVMSASPSPADTAAPVETAAIKTAPVETAATKAAVAPPTKDLSSMTMEDLEAEMARRRAAGAGKA